MVTQEERNLIATIVQDGKIPQECMADARSLAARIIISRSACQETENTVAALRNRQPRSVGLFFHQMRKCGVIEMNGPPLSQEEKRAMGPSDEIHVGLQQRAEKALGEPDVVALLQDPISGEAEMEAALDDQESFDAAIRDAAAKQGVDLDAMVAEIPPDVRKQMQQELEEDPRLRALLEE